MKSIADMTGALLTALSHAPMRILACASLLAFFGVFSPAQAQQHLDQRQLQLRIQELKLQQSQQQLMQQQQFQLQQLQQQQFQEQQLESLRLQQQQQLQLKGRASVSHIPTIPAAP